MADIFISYSSEDEDVAKRLCEILEDDGCSVWWDRQIILGQVFSRRIDQELASAQCVIVVWSSASCESNWVETEASEGLENGILIPVQIEKCRIPIQFRRLNTANLRDWDKDDVRHPGITRVRESVSGLLSRPSERESDIRTPKRTRQIDPVPGDAPKPDHSEQLEDMHLFVPYVDIQIDGLSEAEGNQFMLQTKVSGWGTKRLFDFADESISWTDFYHYLDSKGQSDWLEELGRAISRARNSRTVGALEQTFRAPTDDRVYRPILYSNTGTEEGSQSFRILFLEEKDPRLPPMAPRNIVQLNAMMRTALEFRYRVIEPFRNALKEDKRDDSAKLMTDLRNRIEEQERVSSESGLLSVDNFSALFSQEKHGRLQEFFELFSVTMATLSDAIESGDEKCVSDQLEELLRQNKEFLEMVSTSFKTAVGRI